MIQRERLAILHIFANSGLSACLCVRFYLILPIWMARLLQLKQQQQQQLANKVVLGRTLPEKRKSVRREKICETEN